MNTSGKFFVVAACVLGAAVALNITMSRLHPPHDDVSSSAQIAPAPTEPAQVERLHHRGSTLLPVQATAIQPEPDAAGASRRNPDALEDPDQLRAWARSNPHDAREWLASASEGARRDVVAEMVCLQIAETNAAAAVALADHYGAGCSNVLENLMAQWADKDLQAAYQWATARPPGTQRDSFLSRIAFVESKTDPEYAGRLVAEQIPPGPIQDEAAISVLYQWAQKNPDAAMRWAQSISAGTLHDRAVTEVQNVMASNSR